MSLLSSKPIIYLITSGETQAATSPQSEAWLNLLRLATAAADAKVDLFQIREKNLSDRSLYELACAVARILQGSSTRLVINDRADVAFAAGAGGVHLTSRSLSARVTRNSFGEQFLIGVSAHTVAEVTRAEIEGADFAVFGPVFETRSKRLYGEPAGLARLSEAVKAVAPFPILALGGVSLDNAADCYRAGANGIAAISVLNNPDKLDAVVKKLREGFSE